MKVTLLGAKTGQKLDITIEITLEVCSFNQFEICDKNTNLQLEKNLT